MGRPSKCPGPPPTHVGITRVSRWDGRAWVEKKKACTECATARKKRQRELHDWFCQRDGWVEVSEREKRARLPRGVRASEDEQQDKWTSYYLHLVTWQPPDAQAWQAPDAQATQGGHGGQGKASASMARHATQAGVSMSRHAGNAEHGRAGKAGQAPDAPDAPDAHAG